MLIRSSYLIVRPAASGVFIDREGVDVAGGKRRGVPRGVSGEIAEAFILADFQPHTLRSHVGIAHCEAHSGPKAIDPLPQLIEMIEVEDFFNGDIHISLTIQTD